MSVPAKTANQVVFATQVLAVSTRLISSEIDVRTVGAVGADLYVAFGRQSATAYTNSPQIIVQGSPSPVGTTADDWTVLDQVSPVLGTSLTALAASGTVTSGQKTIGLASTTNLSIDDMLFISNGTIGNSEWADVDSISVNTNVVVAENLLFTQTGATLYRLAEKWRIPLDLSKCVKIRVVVDNANNAVAGGVVIRAKLVTQDS